MKNINLLILFFASLLTSCNNREPNLPYVYNTNPHYTKGYVEFFGAEYANSGFSNNILSVSLLSDSLTVNSEGSLEGTGQYLFLEDVYVAPTDTFLPIGTYTINSSGLPFTVSPGINDTVDTEVYQIGATISYYEENTANSILKLITEGSFTVDTLNQKYIINCNFKTADKKELKGSFTAALPHYDESLKLQRHGIRKKHLFLGF